MTDFRDKRQIEVIEENPEKLSQDFTVLFFEEKKRGKKKNQHKLLYLIANWSVVNYLLIYLCYEKYERPAHPPAPTFNPKYRKTFFISLWLQSFFFGFFFFFGWSIISLAELFRATFSNF